MKNAASFLSLLLLMAFTSCKQSGNDTTHSDVSSAPIEKGAEKKQEPEAVVGNLRTANMEIEGMSCAVMCAAKIEKELAAMPGVQSAKVDFETKTATVQYDDAKITEGDLSTKVASVGGGKLYKVSKIEKQG